MRGAKSFLILGVVAAGVSAHAQSYSFTGDFGASTNPKGQFSYGSKASFTTSTFTLFGSNIVSSGFKGWGQTTALAGAAVVKNTSGATATIGSGSFASNSVVFLPTGGANPVIRFTTPTAGAYRMNGTFTLVPTDAATDGVNVEIHEFNGATHPAILDSFLLAPSGSVSKAFDFTVSGLAAGAFLDFSVSRGPANKTGDAVKLTGSVSAVPEPATIGAFGLGLAAFLRRLRIKKQ